MRQDTQTSPKLDTVKPLPHESEAEENILASILIERGECLPKVASILRPSDFYHEDLRTIYQAMLLLDAREEVIDEVTLGSELSGNQQVGGVGWRAKLSGLIAKCVTSLHSEYYAELVKRASRCRQLITVAADIFGKGFQAGSNIEAVIRESQDALLRLSSNQTALSIITPPEVAAAAAEMYQERRNGIDQQVMKYGLADLDKLTGGAHRGDFIIVAGHTGMGKSALSQGCARRIAQSHKVLYFSTEMSLSQLIDREMAVILDCSTGILTEGHYDDDFFGDIIKACGTIGERNLFYFNSAAVTTSDIHWACTKMKQQFGLDLVVVDYIQQLADEYGRSQNERVGYMTRKLKNIALSLDIAMVGVSQLNRESEKMDDKRPKRWQLRDSGSLEQDADVIMFLYRDDYYYTLEEWNRKYPLDKFPDKPYPKNVVEVLIEKQRQREAPIMHKVTWDGKTMQHRDYADPEKVEPTTQIGESDLPYL